MDLGHDALRPGPRSELRIEEAVTLERLERIVPAWEDLWSRARSATPFSSPAWLLPWCRHLMDAAPWALLAWRGPELAALLPGFVYRVGAVRVLGLLGGGVSDYQDAVAEDVAAAESLLGVVADRSDVLDVADLQALPRDSPLLGAAVPPGVARAVGVEDVCPVLPLPARVEDLAARASPKLLADLRYRRRRLARDGAVELARATPETVAAILPELFRLHRARWGARGGTGVLARGRLERFHAEAARSLASRGLLRLYALRLDGATVGVLHGLAARGRVHLYLHGIDPAHASRSPGGLLFLHAIEDAIAEGAHELDLLRGRERYKYRWGAEDRPTLRLTLLRREGAHG
jgi:CelD/BcsL family acetyltransferase involved in cellulose biosynthesis